jgi:hypothetical protein
VRETTEGENPVVARTGGRQSRTLGWGGSVHPGEPPRSSGSARDG